jgi:hypothetical protein
MVGMAKKKKTLPKDFTELLTKGDLAELKDVFTGCAVDAYGGYGKQTALAYDSCPHELAKWLLDQGADLHFPDRWGNTPLHNRSRSIFGNIKSLLELGADVHKTNTSIDTPLHAAADAHNPENVETLIQYGADVNAKNARNNTPLEEALMTCRNIDILQTLKISEICLKAGAERTAKMAAYVTEIGKQFEFHRAGFNKDQVDAVSDALHKLYDLFEVSAVGKRIVHDGKSAIKTNSESWQQQHQELWELLVPSSGAAETLQGEVIRITGRIANELEGNGGINWDGDYNKMGDALFEMVKQGESLGTSELEEIGEIVKALKHRGGDTSRLCELAVEWVLLNPLPLKLGRVSYQR